MDGSQGEVDLCLDRLSSSSQMRASDLMRVMLPDSPKPQVLGSHCPTLCVLQFKPPHIGIRNVRPCVFRVDGRQHRSLLNGIRTFAEDAHGHHLTEVGKAFQAKVKVVNFCLSKAGLPLHFEPFKIERPEGAFRETQAWQWCGCSSCASWSLEWVGFAEQVGEIYAGHEVHLKPP